MEVFAPELPIGLPRLVIELLFGGGPDQALFEDKTGENADREGAATEAEGVNLVGVMADIPRRELVEIEDVALQAPAKGAADQRRAA